METTTTATLFTEKDKASIHHIYAKSPLHKRTLGEMAKLERIRGTTDINRFRVRMLHTGLQCSLDEVVAVFKDLEKAGFGKLTLGSYKSSVPFRFQWKKYNIVAIGKEATKEDKKASVAKPTSEVGYMTMFHKAPNGVRIRLSFNTKEEVKQLINDLQEMLS